MECGLTGARPGGRNFWTGYTHLTYRWDPPPSSILHKRGDGFCSSYMQPVRYAPTGSTEADQLRDCARRCLTLSKCHSFSYHASRAQKNGAATSSFFRGTPECLFSTTDCNPPQVPPSAPYWDWPALGYTAPSWPSLGYDDILEWSSYGWSLPTASYTANEQQLCHYCGKYDPECPSECALATMSPCEVPNPLSNTTNSPLTSSDPTDYRCPSNSYRVVSATHVHPGLETCVHSKQNQYSDEETQALLAHHRVTWLWSTVGQSCTAACRVLSEHHAAIHDFRTSFQPMRRTQVVAFQCDRELLMAAKEPPTGCNQTVPRTEVDVLVMAKPARLATDRHRCLWGTPGLPICEASDPIVERWCPCVEHTGADEDLGELVVPTSPPTNPPLTINQTIDCQQVVPATGTYHFSGRGMVALKACGIGTVIVRLYDIRGQVIKHNESTSCVDLAVNTTYSVSYWAEAVGGTLELLCPTPAPTSNPTRTPTASPTESPTGAPTSLPVTMADVATTIQCVDVRPTSTLGKNSAFLWSAGEVVYSFDAQQHMVFDACDSDFNVVLWIRSHDEQPVTYATEGCPSGNGARLEVNNLGLGLPYFLVVEGQGEQNHGNVTLKVTCHNRRRRLSAEKLSSVYRHNLHLGGLVRMRQGVLESVHSSADRRVKKNIRPHPSRTFDVPLYEWDGGGLGVLPAEVPYPDALLVQSNNETMVRMDRLFTELVGTIQYLSSEIQKFQRRLPEVVAERLYKQARSMEK